MNLKTLGLLTALVAVTVAANAAQARIYKTVDEDGNVVFTDVPPKDNATSVEINPANLYKPATVPAAAAPGAAEQTEEADEATTYASLRIVAPTDDEPVRENAGNIDIAVAVSPRVDTQSGHSLQILLDGAVQASNSATRISLTNVDRGTHVITAQVVDADGNVLISADPVSFHMLRTSVLTRRPAN